MTNLLAIILMIMATISTAVYKPQDQIHFYVSTIFLHWILFKSYSCLHAIVVFLICFFLKGVSNNRSSFPKCLTFGDLFKKDKGVTRLAKLTKGTEKFLTIIANFSISEFGLLCKLR